MTNIDTKYLDAYNCLKYMVKLTALSRPPRCFRGRTATLWQEKRSGKAALQHQNKLLCLQVSI